MGLRFCIIFTVIVFSTIGSFGCNRVPARPEEMPELVPCVIHVNFGGEKIADIGVILHPKNPRDNPWTAGGKTDQQGRCPVKTSAFYTGAVPGEYRVSFQKHAEPEIDSGGMPLPAKSLIPPQYAPSKTTLSIVVSKEKKEHTFNLEGLDSQSGP